MTKKEQIQKRRQEILVMLRASDREHPVPLVQLMEQFDASRRTIYDDIKALQESGFYRIHNQESSYAQALALQYKKAYILSFKKDESISDEEFIDQWLDEEKNMKKMADSEHDRWSAYQILHGWKTADEKQTAAIIAKYEGKRANDPKLRLHPAIVANSKLKKTEDMVNRLFKQYGSNKTVNYLEADRGIIAKINYILKDK